MGALDKKIIEPAEVVGVDTSEDDADADDEPEGEPSGEAEVVVLSDEDEVDDVVLTSNTPSDLPRAFDACNSNYKGLKQRYFMYRAIAAVGFEVIVKSWLLPEG
ncbi:hypothetical protein ACTXT7_017028 [Hymenolepis weldensis]